MTGILLSRLIFIVVAALLIGTVANTVGFFYFRNTPPPERIPRGVLCIETPIC